MLEDSSTQSPHTMQTQFEEERKRIELVSTPLISQMEKVDGKGVDWETLSKSEEHEQQEQTRAPIDSGFLRQRIQRAS